ncbi:MAG: class I SAM-dependent methyltransferase [Acidobacteria bacterium]|nr:class I SAM-dependent methyltransferase [Acidobacteriota bacterium]
MSEYYKSDLAFIHDTGFADFAITAAPGILQCLRQHQIHQGLIVDLGCGSGIWAEQLHRAGYQVLGVDISPAMIDLARNRVPEADFRVDSLFQAEIPTCVAVTSMGECINYLFDPENTKHQITQLFQRIYQALTPGGIFIFDIAEPGQCPPNTTIKHFTEGTDWLVLVEKTEDPETATLTRRIITFRQVGDLYRRDEEIHRQQLYWATELAKELCQIGFEVYTSPKYGDQPLPPVRMALIARKH